MESGVNTRVHNKPVLDISSTGLFFATRQTLVFMIGHNYTRIR